MDNSTDLGFESMVRRLSLETILMVSLVIILSLSALSYLSLQIFETKLLPELQRKAETVGNQVAGAVIRATELGIPFRELVGMEVLLDQVKDSQAEIGFLRVVDRAGEAVYPKQQPSVNERGNTEFQPYRPFALPDPAPQGPEHLESEAYLTTVMPLKSDATTLGYLLVGTDRGFVRKQQLEIIYDILTTLMISMLITFEILFVMIALNLLDPLKQVIRMLMEGERGNFFCHSQEGRSRDELGTMIRGLNRINFQIGERYRHVLGLSQVSPSSLNAVVAEEDRTGQTEDRASLDQRSRNPTSINRGGMSNLRLPLFVFFFGSELSRSFLPLFARSLYEPGMGISQDFAVALPFSVYLVFFMAATPISGALSARFGPRRLFILGLIPSFVGFGLTSITGSLLELIVFRALNGIGYAMVSIAAIGYIVDISSKRSRAQGMAVFFNASMIAGISGSAIGGILADRLGYGLTFVLSAVLTVAAAVLIWRLLPRPEPSAIKGTGTGLRFGYLFTLLKNPRFVYLTLFCAMPTQVILTGFFFYLAPLYLSHLGNSASVIGRLMMIYFLVVILVGPQVAKLTDRGGLHRRAISIGVLVAGLGMLLVGYWESTLTVAVAIVTLALGNSMILSNQPSVLLSVTPLECRSLGQTTVLGIFRLLERAGGATGPFIMAYLVSTGTFQGATAFIGGFALTCGIFFLLSGMTRIRPIPSAEESTS